MAYKACGLDGIFLPHSKPFFSGLRPAGSSEKQLCTLDESFSRDPYSRVHQGSFEEEVVSNFSMKTHPGGEFDLKTLSPCSARGDMESHCSLLALGPVPCSCIACTP